MNDKQSLFKEELIIFIRRLCRSELRDPTQIDLSDPQVRADYQTVLDHYHNYGAKVVEQLQIRGPFRDDDVETKERCFALMASTTAWLIRGVIRIGSIVGRETQGGVVVDFLQSVMPTLRKGLGLETIPVDLKVKLARMLEADFGIGERRRVLGKRKRELEELRQVLQSGLFYITDF